jgi:RimJ/RimL family protein N-acetyltransferase
VNITIRPWALEDNDTLMDWIIADRSILSAMRVPEETSNIKIMQVLLAGLSDHTQQRFMAEREGEPVAALSVYDITPYGAGVVSIIANPLRKNGFETVAAARQGLKAMFNGIGFTKLTAIVSEDNEKALKLRRLLGFKDMNVRVLQMTKEQHEAVN